MTPPRGVLHLRASRFVGGPERQILRYAKLADDLGVVSTVASFVGDGEGTALLDASARQATATLALPPGTLSAMASLTRFLRANPQALICTHGYKADILGILAGQITGTPVASFLRGWTGEDAKVRLYESLNRMMLRWSDRVVALSETQRKQLAGAGFGEKTVVVNNVVDLVKTESAVAHRELRSRLKMPTDAVIVACAGRLSPEKGTTFFITAAKSLSAEFTRAHFVIFGDGRLRDSLQAEAAGWPNIHFAGHLGDFRELVAGIDVLVNPSLAEEMPNVVLEAMSAGVPSVATSVGGVAEIALPGPAIEIIAPGDPQAMAAAVSKLLREPALAKSLGEAGRRRTVERYSPEHQQTQLGELIRAFLPRSQALSPLPPAPFISVVIPVRNEQKHIGSVLQQLEQQDYPAARYEILVADGNSTDETRTVVEEFGKTARVAVQLVPNPRQLSSAGRNAGIRASRGDVIAFIDGHCQIPSTKLLANMIELMRAHDAACLCRPQPLHAAGNTRFQDALAHTRATILGHGRDSTIFDMEHEGFVDPSSSGAVYRAEIFTTIGLYDESFDACEDVEFNFRVGQAGFAAYSSPQVAVNYSPRQDIGGLWKQLTRYGRGRYRFMRKHPEAISVAQLVPAAFVLWLTSLAATAWMAPFAAWALAGTLVVYGAVTLAFAIRLSFRYGWHHLYLSPAVYACIHLGLGMGFWREAFAGGRPQSEQAVVGTAQPLRAGEPGDTAAKEFISATSNKR